MISPSPPRVFWVGGSLERAQGAEAYRLVVADEQLVVEGDAEHRERVGELLRDVDIVGGRVESPLGWLWRMMTAAAL